MQEVIRELIQPGESKIVLCVLDGLGGLPFEGRTELEAASTPNLDGLARVGACGLHIPVARGITPGLLIWGYLDMTRLNMRSVAAFLRRLGWELNSLQGTWRYGGTSQL